MGVERFPVQKVERVKVFLRLRFGSDLDLALRRAVADPEQRPIDLPGRYGLRVPEGFVVRPVAMRQIEDCPDWWRWDLVATPART